MKVPIYTWRAYFGKERAQRVVATYSDIAFTRTRVEERSAKASKLVQAKAWKTENSDISTQS